MDIGAYRYQNEDGSIFFRGRIRWYEGPRRLELTAPRVRQIEGDALRDAESMQTMAEKRGVKVLAQILFCGMRDSRSRLWKD